MAKKTSDFRVKSYGDTSYWPRTNTAALSVADQIMARNGCGLIEERMADGLWHVIARFEPWTGVVIA